MAEVPESALVICESWGSEPPADDIDCRLALGLAVSVLGGADAGRVDRFDVRYGAPCVADGGCERRADIRTVIAVAASFESLVIRVARDPSRGILVWPPVPAPPFDPPAFAAPRVAAPAVAPDAPVQVRDRAPLPFCGRESQSAPEAFDTKARKCFVAGIDAWTPVEMISDETTEDGVLIRVLRFDRTGPIVEFLRTPAGWVSSRCGLSPIATIAVFVLAECGRTERL